MRALTRQHRAAAERRDETGVSGRRHRKNTSHAPDALTERCGVSWYTYVVSCQAAVVFGDNESIVFQLSVLKLDIVE